MMRRFAPCAGLILLMLTAAPLARAEQKDVRPLLDRRDRLERDINLLQRQVYRGGAGNAPVPATPPGDANTALNFEMRVGRIEDQMRTMTGQIEETSYKIEQLRVNLQKLQSDLEVRFNQLEGGGNLQNAPSGGAPAPQAMSAPPLTPPAAQPTPLTAPLQLRPPPPANGNTADTQTLGKQPGTLGMIRVPEGQEVGGAATSNPVLGQVAPAPAGANVASAGATNPQD